MTLALAPTATQFHTHCLHLGLSYKTSDTYARRVGNFLISGLEPIEWIHALREADASASVIKGALAALKVYADYAGLNRDPLDRYKTPAVPPAKPHPLPEGIEDARALMRYAGDPIIRKAIALGCLAGLRVEETVTLNIADVDFRGRRIIVKGKGGKTRHVPLSAELAEILSGQEVGKVVPLSNSWARARIAEVAEFAGIRHSDGKAVSSHDLRATFATAFYEKTNDIVLLQRILGHASVTTTQGYIGTTAAAAAQGVDF